MANRIVRTEVHTIKVRVTYSEDGEILINKWPMDEAPFKAYVEVLKDIRRDKVEELQQMEHQICRKGAQVEELHELVQLLTKRLK